MLSLRATPTRTLRPLLRYPLAFVVLFLCSLPPLIVLQALRAHFPDLFPPRKFVS
jgi:hypothetical protein